MLRPTLFLGPTMFLRFVRHSLYAAGIVLAMHGVALAAADGCDPATSPTPCVVARANLPAAPAAIPATESIQLDDGDVITAATGSAIVILRDPSTGTYRVGVAPQQQ